MLRRAQWRGCARLLPTLLLATLLPALGASAAAGLEPGDVITAGNREQARALLPAEIWPFVKDFEGLHMEIVERQDYPVHPKYREATVKYACQASLDEHGQLVNYTAGQPFPYSEWAQEATDHACDLSPEDPQFALKLAWNANQRWNGGVIDMPKWAQSYWRDASDNTWKIALGEYRRTWFSHRADLLPERTRLKEDTELEWAEYSETHEPFDLRGAAFLVFRYRDSVEKRDDAWSYVPSLRRVRRLSTAQKADSVQGTNFTLEDFFLFSGYVWDQEWSFEGESEMLVALDSERRCYPYLSEEAEAQGIERGSQEHFFSCRFGPYRALPLVNETWQKRPVIALEQVPKRSGHPYSRKVLWYDKETFQPLLFLAWDAEGKPFRLSWYLPNWSETSGIPGNEGRYAHIFAAAGVVDLQAGTSNLFLGFSANAKPRSAEEALEYFDTTRLKQSR